MDRSINLITNDTTNNIAIVNDKLVTIIDNKITEVTANSSDQLLSGRPIKISELNNYLRIRDWNNSPKMYIGTDNKLSVRYYTAPEPENIINSDEVVLGTVGNIIVEDIPISDVIMKDFESTHSFILTDMNKNEIYLYNSPHLIIDLLEDSIELNIISENSNLITDTINFQELVNNGNPSLQIGAVIKINVQYVKNSVVYYHQTLINLIEIDKSNKIEIIDDNVSLEFINGILRLKPLSLDVTECIISNCTLIYGKLG